MLPARPPPPAPTGVSLTRPHPTGLVVPLLTLPLLTWPDLFFPNHRGLAVLPSPVSPQDLARPPRKDGRKMVSPLPRASGALGSMKGGVLEGATV